MSGTTGNWWTNKRVLMFGCWTFVFGIVGLFFEEEKQYDPDSIYKVDTYRRRILQKSEIVAGGELVSREKGRIRFIRVASVMCLFTSCGCLVVLVNRIQQKS